MIKTGRGENERRKFRASSDYLRPLSVQCGEYNRNVCQNAERFRFANIRPPDIVGLYDCRFSVFHITRFSGCLRPSANALMGMDALTDAQCGLLSQYDRDSRRECIERGTEPPVSTDDACFRLFSVVWGFFDGVFGAGEGGGF
jgi:hypothetical protein